MAEKREKIAYLDGMRGLAALGVLFTHMVVSFYPAIYTGNPAQAQLADAADAALGHSVWAGCLASNLAVSTLFLLSSYVLSFRFFMTGDSSIATANAYRRYMRLVGPVLFSMLLGWLLLRLGLFANGPVAQLTHSEWFLGSYFTFAPDLGEAVAQAFWKCFSVTGVQTYNPPLWTMNYELLGSFSVFGFQALFGRSPRRWVVYAVMALVFMRSFYLAFVIGMVLSDMRYSPWGEPYRRFLQERPWFCLLLFAGGAFFGTYFLNGQTPWSRWLDFWVLQAMGVDLFTFYHVIGAGMLFACCLYHKGLQRILSWRPLLFVGRVSFSLYLLHFLLLCSLGCHVFLWLQGRGLPYFGSVLGVAAVLVPVALLAAWALTVCLDEPAMKAVKRLQKRYLY